MSEATPVALYAPLPVLVEIMIPAVAWWRAACGVDLGGTRTDAERLVTEYTEESARAVRALLAARRPASETSLSSAVEAMCDRWGSRAHRIEERLARELETAVAGSTPTPDLLSSARPHELEEEVRAADFAREHNERQARELRGRIGAHPELDAFTGELEHARSALDTLRARIQEAKR